MVTPVLAQPFFFYNKERTGTELVDTVKSVVDPEAVEMVVIYLPYQELETSDGFPCIIKPVDPVDCAN